MHVKSDFVAVLLFQEDAVSTHREYVRFALALYEDICLGSAGGLAHNGLGGVQGGLLPGFGDTVRRGTLLGIGGGAGRPDRVGDVFHGGGRLRNGTWERLSRLGAGGRGRGEVSQGV